MQRFFVNSRVGRFRIGTGRLGLPREMSHGPRALAKFARWVGTHVNYIMHKAKREEN